MKKTYIATLFGVLVLCPLSALAQGPEGHGGPPPPHEGQPGMRRPVPPIMRTLDLNHDGTISADEIAKASESLKKLDKNKDGKLTEEELHPGRPEGDREGQRGQRGERGQRGGRPGGPEGPGRPDGPPPPPRGGDGDEGPGRRGTPPPPPPGGGDE